MAKALMTLDEVMGHHGNTVRYYRCVVMNPPRGWTQEQLAEAMSVSTRWVQEIERMEYIQDIHRRKALAIVLGIPAALLNIETLERFSERTTIRLKPAMLKSLERGMQSRWHAYYSSSNQVTEEGLLEQIEVLEQLADNSGGDSKHIARILATSYQLAGTLARDNFKYSRAKKYFRDALDFAKESESPDLVATSVARHALVLLRQERKDDALLLYSEAANLAKRAQPLVRAYVSSGLAEALARKGQPDACYRQLDLAERLLHQAGAGSPEDDLAGVRLTIQSLQDDRGECYVLSGQPWKGIAYLQAAEMLLPTHLSRNHCRLLMQQAEAYLAACEPDTCVGYAIEGLRIARELGSVGNINWASEIHDKLLSSAWKNEPVVGRLGAAIVAK
jgi:transcriptional regulator with XRE-family HTH domain